MNSKFLGNYVERFFDRDYCFMSVYVLNCDLPEKNTEECRVRERKAADSRTKRQKREMEKHKNN